MSETGARKTRVLVIDDNPGDTELLRMALEAAGADCELTILDNGWDALEFVRRQGSFAGAALPDLVVLDLNLPRNDGAEILETMRAGDPFSAVPVAVLTSSSSSRERARVENLNIECFIVKPSNLDAFLKIGAILRDILARNLSARTPREGQPGKAEGASASSSNSSRT